MQRRRTLWVIGILLLLIAGGGKPGTAESPMDNAAPIVPDFVVSSGNILAYGLTDEGILVYSSDGGVTWHERHQGLPERKIYPFYEVKKRPLTSLAVDIKNPSRVAVTTASSFYLSEDEGISWRRIPVYLPGGAYITAVAIAAWAKDRFMIGTGFSGVFETKNGGASWRQVAEVPEFYQGAGFREEVRALAYHPVREEGFFLASGFGHGIYRIDGQGKVTALSLEDWPKNRVLKNLYVKTYDSPADEPGQLVIEDLDNRFHYRLTDLGLLAKEARNSGNVCDPGRQNRLTIASGRFGIYLQPQQCKGQRLKAHIQFMKENHLNAVVVDFKDDGGNLTYDSQLVAAKEAGAVRSVFSAKSFIDEAKKHNIYVIARLVVFKDARLYAYQQHRYAAWDGPANRPWGNMVETKSGKLSPKECWVDPYATEVWAYNLAIAEELQRLGVDEIQFDYIRFPTDGPVGRIRYRHRAEGMEKIDALESFLAQAREILQIPISTDLYGFNCWYKMEGWTGQNLQRFAEYVDVVCPMYYPSHFPRSFMKETPYLERSYRIYLEGVRRAKEITGGRCIIRPYVQAFLLGGERQMTEPTYKDYLNKQVDGVLEADKTAGFTLWNNSNNYYMVGKAFEEKLRATN